MRCCGWCNAAAAAQKTAPVTAVPLGRARAWTLAPQASGAPKGTPADIVNLLNKEPNGALGDAKIKARIDELGGTVTAGSSAELGTLIAEATEKWAKVIKFAGIKAE